MVQIEESLRMSPSARSHLTHLTLTARTQASLAI